MNIVQKTSWKITALVSGATLVVGGLVGAGITMAASDKAADTGACVAAIGHADDAMDLYRGAFRDASDAIGAYLSNDYRSMDTYTSNINTAADDVQSVLIDYVLHCLPVFGRRNYDLAS